MRNQIVTALRQISLLAIMAMVTAVGTAQAQSLNNKMKANIPFDFVIGDKKLPAGEYSFTRANNDSGDSLLRITGISDRSNTFSFSSPARVLEPKDKATLVFHHLGDQYFLFQVWPAGGSTGRTLVKSNNEREAERKARQGNVALKADMVEIVTLVADLQ